MLSRRAADADAGASGIAATVGAATHTLHLFPFHPSPFSLSNPLYPFRKAASLAVGATHTPLTALHNACNPPHPPTHPDHLLRPTDCHPPSTRRSSPPRPPPHGPLLPRCLFDPLPLVTTYRIHARIYTHIYIYIHTCLSPCTHVYLAYQVTRTYLLFPTVASSPLLSPLLSRFLFSFPILLPSTLF